MAAHGKWQPKEVFDPTHWRKKLRQRWSDKQDRKIIADLRKHYPELFP